MTKSNISLTLLKSLLIVQTVALIVYSLIAANKEGWSLFNIFTENVASLNWNGQFNLDFSSYLLLSGLWIMWRNKFTISSMIIGVIAMIAGIVVFAPYLLYLLIIEKGDLKKLLVGER